MNTNQKELIVAELTRLAAKTSQKKVANRAGVSNATISQMINGKWKLIADEMWRKVMVTLRIDTTWKIAPTNNFKILQDLLASSKELHMSIGVSYHAGVGKSESYRFFEKVNDNVIYVECKNYWTKKSYIKNLLMASGLEVIGTTEQMIESFIEHLMGLANPIIIIDQLDKLKDAQMDLFMDFYNDLYNHCGFMLSGVPALKKRILNGVLRDKIGYAELWSRIGRKWIDLDPTSLKDVRAVCNVNGVFDELLINEAYNICDGDLRRVRREVEKYFLNKKAA